MTKAKPTKIDGPFITAMIQGDMLPIAERINLVADAWPDLTMEDFAAILHGEKIVVGDEPSGFAIMDAVDRGPVALVVQFAMAQGAKLKENSTERVRLAFPNAEAVEWFWDEVDAQSLVIREFAYDEGELLTFAPSAVVTY